MIKYAMKILIKKRSLGFLLGMVFIISLIMLNLVSQVGTLVDANLEYGFKEYRPHSVYRVMLDFGRNSTNLTEELRTAIEDLRAETSNNSTESGVLIAFSWSLLKPVRIDNHTVNVVVYLFETPKDLRAFGFGGNFSSSSIVLLKERLNGNISAGDVISRVFNGSVELRKAYGIFKEYPLLENKEVEYVQVAAPLREWAVNACIRRGNSLLINSSGYVLPVYIAVNFRSIHRDPSVLEKALKKEIPDRIINSTVKFYQEERCRNRPMIVFGDDWAYLNGTWLSITPKELEYKLSQILLENRKKWCMMGKLIGPELEKSDILTIVKNSGSQTLKFFGLFGGLLVVFYLPLFLMLIYSGASMFSDLRKDLEVLSLRGISSKVTLIQKTAVFLLTIGVSLAAYRIFEETTGRGLPVSAELAVVILVLVSVAISDRAASFNLSSKVIASAIAFMGVLIALGYARINETVLLARGYGGLSIFLAMLTALIPLLGLFVGSLFQRMCVWGLSLLERPFDTRYYFRWLKNYGQVITFSAYSLSIALIPRITSIHRVLEEIYRNEYLAVVGYPETVSLDIFGRYLSALGTWFALFGLLSIAVLAALSFRQYLRISLYSGIRGMEKTEVRRSFLKFMTSQLIFVVVLSLLITAFLVAFVDAYIGLVYTRAEITFTGGKFIVESLFRPPHIWGW